MAIYDFMNGTYLLLHCKFGPLDTIILHNIISFFHTQLLIEWNCLFICYQIYGDIFFPACFIMCSLHKLSANSLSLISSVNPQICHIKPICIIC